MSVTGHPETGPTRAGFAVCDAIAGMTAAFAVSSALYQRTHTGRGQLVDVAMLDAALSFLTTYVTDFTVGGHVQGQLGNRAQSRLPTADVFKVKGGHILLAVNNEKQFVRPGQGYRPAGLPQDPRFVDWPARLANEAALRAIIEEVFAEADDKTWEARLTASRRALLARVDHPGDRHPPAARPSRRAATGRDAPWRADLRRLGLPPRARQRQHRPRRRRYPAPTPRRSSRRPATARPRSPLSAATAPSEPAGLGIRRQAPISRAPQPDPRWVVGCGAPRACPWPARRYAAKLSRPIFTAPRLLGMPSPPMKASSTSPASRPAWDMAADDQRLPLRIRRLVPAHDGRQHDARRVSVRHAEFGAEHVADAVAGAHRHAAGERTHGQPCAHLAVETRCEVRSGRP